MERYQLVPCISASEVKSQVDRLAAEINRDYAGKELVLIGVLKGSFVFLADLMRRLTVPLRVDFIRLSSYGNQVETSGDVQITKNLELPIRDQEVLVVEDIVDTGLSMTRLLEYLRSHQPGSLRVCALIDKYERRQVEFQANYVGIRLDKGFVVGYGLDFSEKYRHLPDICEVRFIQE
jgi:hypoxanthine phosphoribosyltransferase